MGYPRTWPEGSPSTFKVSEAKVSIALSASNSCYFPFDFESRIWDLIVSVPDHC